MKKLDGPVRKQMQATVDKIVAQDPATMAQTHPLTGPLKGWNATKGSRGHRVVHQPNPETGGIHIGYVGLHEYDKAIQRLTHLDPKAAEVRHVSDEASDGDGVTGGMMIALVPPATIVEDLVLEEGEGAEQLHITLAYLGKTDEYSDVLLDGLHEVMEAWADGQPKFTATVQGVGTFLPADEDGQHVLWASVDAPGLHRVHAHLVDYLKEHGYEPREDHSFTPHLTLAYGKHHFRFVPKIKRRDFKVHEVWVCVGGRWESLPLRG